MVACSFVVLAGLFSFLEPPMSKFAEQYYEWSYNSKLSSIKDSEFKHIEKIAWELEDLEHEMKVKRRNENAIPSVLGEYEQNQYRVIANRNTQIVSFFDKQIDELKKEHDGFRHELDMRKKAFGLTDHNPTSEETRVFNKFKDCGCKIKKLTESERSILWSYFMKDSKDWIRVRYKRGHCYMDKY